MNFVPLKEASKCVFHIICFALASFGVAYADTSKNNECEIARTAVDEHFISNWGVSTKIRSVGCDDVTPQGSSKSTVLGTYRSPINPRMIFVVELKRKTESGPWLVCGMQLNGEDSSDSASLDNCE